MAAFIYIITNGKRGLKATLHVGLCKNIHKVMEFYYQMPTLFYDPKDQMTCLVYLEEFSVYGDASMERFKELSSFNILQKEELINNANPEWIDIATQINA